MSFAAPPQRPETYSVIQRMTARHGRARVLRWLATKRLRHFIPGVAEEWADVPAIRVAEHIWTLHRYAHQVPPSGDWFCWTAMGGRGSGKGAAASHWLYGEVQRASALVAAGRLRPTQARFGAIAATAKDLRKTVVEGDSGLLRCNTPWFAGLYEPANTRVVYPHGAQVDLFTAEEAQALRGPNLAAIWADDLAAWRGDPEEVWDNAMFALRLGDDPRVVISTTPRPGPLLRGILQDPTTVITTGLTSDNPALGAKAIARQFEKYGGSRTGRQELLGELLEDNPGALWRVADIDAARVTSVPDLSRVIVAVDPAVTSREDSDETGIIVAGIGDCRCTGRNDVHAFVLEDLSGIYTPDGWARTVVRAFERHKADRVIAEVNQGGDLVASTLRTIAPHIPFTAVHATRGKQLRAEGPAALYEQHRVHHLGHFPALETQLVQWDPLRDRWSPDRLDAVVWALTHIMIDETARGVDWGDAQNSGFNHMLHRLNGWRLPGEHIIERDRPPRPPPNLNEELPFDEDDDTVLPDDDRIERGTGEDEDGNPITWFRIKGV